MITIIIIITIITIITVSPSTHALSHTVVIVIVIFPESC